MAGAGRPRLTPAERARLAGGAEPNGWCRAFGAAAVTGRLRHAPGDFVVDEELSFPLSGAGEHLYLRVRKTGQNTRWVARQLARRLGLPLKAIGFAGLKDRHAVTEQWFSAHLPGRPDPDPSRWAMEGIEIIDAVRHTAKLRTGALRGNRFRLVVRDISGDLALLRERLALLQSRPVPNYFGAQRFGHGGANLDLLFGEGARPGREARSFGLSALRSAMFNLWLSQRVESGSWDVLRSGEIAYRPADDRFVHQSKLAPGDCAYATGLLWGNGQNQATGAALAAERAFFAGFAGTCAALACFDVRMMRRPLGVRPQDLEFSLAGTTLELDFSLARGEFATVMLRELGEFFDAT